MATIYGYARVSTTKQDVTRQVRNILAAYPTAHIVQEAYTGTKIVGRKEFEKLLKTVKAGDKIVFDSVSRMSRNAEEGYEAYEKLLKQGVELEFLKEAHVNTATLKGVQQQQQQLSMSVVNTGNITTDTFVKAITAAINDFMLALAKKQIELAFAQSQKEVDDLHARTREGMLTAKLNGKQIGRKQGATITVKKQAPSMTMIRKYSKDFDGTLSDADVMTLTKLSRNTFYKYKKLLREQLQAEQDQ